MMLPPPSRLFDYVVVVALRPDRRDPTSTPIVKPHLRYRFPPLQRDAAGTSAATTTTTAAEPAGRGLRPPPQRALPPAPTTAAAGLDARQLRELQKAAEEERKLYKAVKKFCFPDLPPALSLASFMNTSFATSYGQQQQGETFSFTLTESNGAKRWGYCLRAPGPSQAAPFPQCICIISFLPCFSIFSTILQELTSLQKADGGFEAFTQFLNAVYKEPLPIPGGTLRLTLPLALFPAQVAEPNHGKPGTQPATRAQQSGQTKQINGDVVEYAFTRPDDSESLLDHVNFEPLLHFLDAPNIASILASLLIERRMIFIATNLNTLSSCVQAAASILYPFNWQHIFIPVVPQSLLSFCCAPMPFLVGILRVHLAELKTLSDAMEEVVVVDVDNNKVLFSEDMDDVKLVPPVLLDPLLQSLQRICREVRGVEPGSQSSFSILGSLMGKAKAKERKPLSKALVKDLQNVFIAFMVDLLATYKDFMRKTPVKPAVTTAAFNPTENGFNSKYFDSEGFIESRPADMRALLELVTQAQLFVTFIEERHKRFVNSGKFERRLTTRMSQVLLPGSKEAEQLQMALLRGKLEEPPPSTEPSPGAQPGENRLKTRTRFTMYDTGAITRDEVTKSLWEEEKRREGEQKRLEEAEEKKRKKSALTPAGGAGSGIGSGSGSGIGGGGSSSGGHSETTTASSSSGSGGGMTSIWNRLFSAPGNREDESQGFQISDPSNFRKLDTDLAEYAMSTPGAGTVATVATPPAGAVSGDAGSAAAVTEPTKPAPAFGRGITVGAGGWMKKSGVPIAQHSSGALSAPAVQTAGPSLGGARAPRAATAAASATPVHPYTASSIPSPPTSSGAPSVGQARSREPSGDGQDLFLAGDDAGDESEASSSKIVHEGGLVKLAGQQYYIQLSDKWQLRWFILTETHLSYYRPKDKRKPCGVVPLKKVADISFYVTHPTLKRHNLIELKTKIVGGESGSGTTPRTYYMEAPSKDDGLRWLNAFQQVRLDSQIVNAPS